MCAEVVSNHFLLIANCEHNPLDALCLQIIQYETQKRPIAYGGHRFRHI